MERARLLARRLGRLLHGWRAELGVTQEQMAARCGMSSKHYGQLERGDIEVTLSALSCLTQGLDCGLAELVGQIAHPHHASRPTLDLRTWQRIRSEIQLLNDHATRMIAYAGKQTTSTLNDEARRHDRPGLRRHGTRLT